MHEGYLDSCRGKQCPDSCCLGGTSESIEEHLDSPRFGLTSKLKKNGINVYVDKGAVWYDNCFEQGKCKFLRHFSQEGDIRPLVCKIYPYKIAETSRYGVKISLAPCPGILNRGVPEEFTAEVKRILRAHYKKGLDWKIEVIKG